MLFKEYNRLLFFLKKINIFAQHIMEESLSLEEENIVKDIRNPFRLKEELNYTAIKDIRSLFRLEKETKAIILKQKYLEILRIFLSMKKKKVTNNQ